MKALNVVGAGRVGRTLASLWAERTFRIQDVLDGSGEGARSAVAFIRGGNAMQSLREMRPADVWMISTPDRSIASTSDALAAAGILRAGDIVFHCSGSIASTALGSASRVGAAIASVHPLKAFANAGDAVQTFRGTYCAAEGDPAALDILIPSFEAIGARVSRIDPAFKTIYHAASVVVSNYLVALLETGFRCYEKAGLPRDTATAMIAPIVRETLENVLAKGTAPSLTGPIVRGDDEVVRGHLEALGSWDPDLAQLYRDLGAVALALARQRGELDAGALQRLADTLSDSLVPPEAAGQDVTATGPRPAPG